MGDSGGHACFGRVGGSVRPAVFLDRDGVLNAAIIREGRPYPPSSPAEVEILPGVREACRRLREAGLLLIAVTNQPDIARGSTSAATVEKINERVLRSVGLDALVLCPHDDADACDCRKPKPGLIVAAAAEWHVDLRRSIMVGDRWRDIGAGKAAGVSTVLIKRDYDEPPAQAPDYVAATLSDAVEWIIERAQSGSLEGK